MTSNGAFRLKKQKKTEENGEKPCENELDCVD
jgi:hypothetical protein